MAQLQNGRQNEWADQPLSHCSDKAKVFHSKDGQIGEGIPGILTTMTDFHKAQLALCDRLEKLADGLPDQFDAQAALHVARQILPLIRRAHIFEEETVFGVLVRLPLEGASIRHSLERLKFEHWEDEASAEDLAEALIAFVTGPGIVAADKLGYMLRGFFDNLRRHIAFEAEHIAPLMTQKGTAQTPFQH